MDFWNRYLDLCDQRGMKARSLVLAKYFGVSTAAISGWSKGSLPNVSVLCKIADYFGVTTDYLLGRSPHQVNESDFPLARADDDIFTPEEAMLLKCYRGATPEGRFRIIAACLKESSEG